MNRFIIFFFLKKIYLAGNGGALLAAGDLGAGFETVAGET